MVRTSTSTWQQTVYNQEDATTRLPTYVFIEEMVVVHSSSSMYTPRSNKHLPLCGYFIINYHEEQFAITFVCVCA